MSNSLEYFLRSFSENLEKENIVYTMNGPILIGTEDSLFDLYRNFCIEVKKYCKNINYNIKKVIFVTTYYSELINDEDIYKMDMKSKSIIKVVEKDGEYFAYVFIGYSLSVEDI